MLVYWRVDFQTSDPISSMALVAARFRLSSQWRLAELCGSMGDQRWGLRRDRKAPMDIYGWMVETMGNPLNGFERDDNMGVSENSESHLTGKYGLHIYYIHSLAG